MRRLGLLATLTGLIGVGALAFTTLASAHNFRSGDNVSVGQSQTVDATLLTTGRNIDIAGTVNGDVFCAGQTVNITAAVRGDVICAAQSISINGVVDGDIRLAAQTVTVGGEVKGNATVASQTFTVQSQAKIGQDVTAAASTSVFNGSVGRDLAANAESVTINSNVGRNVQANVERLELTASARVAGALTYRGPNSLTREPGAIVAGNIKYTPERERNNSATLIFGAGLLIYALLALTFIALALALLFPRPIHAVSEQGINRPWLSLLIGFVGCLLMPAIMLTLLLTLIGIPFALLFGLMWLLIVLLSGPMSAYYLGRQILRRSRRPALIMLVGSVVLILLYFVPFLGFVFLLLAVWFGTGMQLLSLFRHLPKPEFVLAEETPKPAKTPAKRAPASQKNRK